MFYCVTFSPTGGTAKVAEILSSNLADGYTKIDLMDKDFAGMTLSREDICLVAMPSFGGRVPPVAMERLRAIRGCGARAIAVAVYGNREFEDTLIELVDGLEECSFRTVAAVAAVAEHSIMRCFASGRPDDDDIRELREYSRGIAERLKEENAVSVQVPGNRPYKTYGVIPIRPVVEGSCTGCGSCLSACPVGAIPGDAPGLPGGDGCIGCMACTAVCPAGVRKVKAEVLAGIIQKLEKACAGRKKNHFF